MRPRGLIFSHPERSIGKGLTTFLMSGERSTSVGHNTNYFLFTNEFYRYRIRWGGGWRGSIGFWWEPVPTTPWQCSGTSSSSSESNSATIYGSSKAYVQSLSAQLATLNTKQDTTSLAAAFHGLILQSIHRAISKRSHDQTATTSLKIHRTWSPMVLMRGSNIGSRSKKRVNVHLCSRLARIEHPITMETRIRR